MDVSHFVRTTAKWFHIEIRNIASTVCLRGESGCDLKENPELGEIRYCLNLIGLGNKTLGRVMLQLAVENVALFNNTRNTSWENIREGTIL